MSTQLVNIQEEQEKQALAIASRVLAPTGNRIRTTLQKTFKMPDGTEHPGPLECVIVDFAAINLYYPTAYNDDNITPPTCFAINLVANDLAPSDNSPEKQADKCGPCPKNEYGTAPNGKSKACKNTRLLAILPPDATEETPLQLLSLSPTAVSAFDDYVLKVARAYKGTPLKVISTLGFDPSVKYATIRFGPPKPNPNFETAFYRQEEARSLLLVEPDVSSFETAPTPTKSVQPRGVMRGAVKR